MASGPMPVYDETVLSRYGGLSAVPTWLNGRVPLAGVSLWLGVLLRPVFQPATRGMVWPATT
jgi:hypothetical protein